MAKKRKGERPDGLVEVKVTIGRDINGKSIRKSFYGHTGKEARDKADDYKLAMQTGSLVDSRMLFKDWAEKWLRIYKKDIKGNTLTKYKNYIDNHIVPYFNQALVASIRPADVRNLYNSKSNYSADFQRQLATLLFAILEDAVDNDIIYKNPAKRIKIEAPRKAREEKRVYSRVQAEQVRQFAATHRFGPEIVLLLGCGLRRSEMLALQWHDIDLEKQTLAINRAVVLVDGKSVVDEPKTARSKRQIPIPDIDIPILQRIEKTALYLFPGSQGNVQRPDTWYNRHYKVFMAEMEKYYLSKKEAAKNAGEPDIEIPPKLNPHELRHTCASLMIEDGVDITTVSRFLGHSDSTITDRVYVHINVEQLRQAITKNTTTFLRQNTPESSQK